MTSVPRPAIQLYSVRDLDEPLANVIRRVADAGFQGVEFATRLSDDNASDVAAALDETGLEAVGAHVPLRAFDGDLDPLLSRYKTVGCRALAVPHLPASHYRTKRRVHAIATRLDDLGARLDDRGFRLLYHNQHHDFAPLAGETLLGRALTVVHPHASTFPQGIPGTVLRLGGQLSDAVFARRYLQPYDATSFPLKRTAYAELVTATDPSLVEFEPDVGAATVAGRSPLGLLDSLADRLSRVHLKDVASGPARLVGPQNSVEPGTGVVDFRAAAACATRHGAEWLIYECDDPVDALRTLENGANAVVPLCGQQRVRA